MERGAYVVTAVLTCAWVGCTASPERVRPYPPPVFETAPERSSVRPSTVSRRSTPPRLPLIEPRWVPRGGVKKRWTDIVIHHSASSSGGARSFDAYHRNVRNWDELGYHFVIGNGTDTADGQIEVGSRWTKQKHGAHCKTADNHYNDHGVGVCLVGDFTRTAPSPAQLAALNKLLLFLTRVCGIPDSRIRTHGGVTQKTDCPGRNFPMAAVKRNLAFARMHATRSGYVSAMRVP